MRIGIIGSGNIGGTTARLFAQAGHSVAISNSRGPDSLRGLVEGTDDDLRATTPEEAVEFGEVVLLAIPWRMREQLPPAERFEGKIVIDAMNPYSETSEVLQLEPSSSSEEVARQLPGARVVKAFNTLNFRPLGSEGRRANAEERLALFLAGDDPDAKAVVAGLIDEAGFEPVDTGSLAEGGRRQQPGSDIYNVPMTAGEARARVG